MEELTEKEIEILELISAHLGNNSLWPQNKDLLRGNQTFSKQNLSNRVRSLRAKGFLENHPGKLIFTVKANAALIQRNFMAEVHPCTLRLISQVKGGPISGSELLSWEDISDEVVSIPEINPKKIAFTTRVVGKSMVKEGIFPGDIAIVERPIDNSLETANDGDLIIAFYLDSQYNFVSVREFNLVANVWEQYKGPVIKYFYTIQSSNQLDPFLYRLGWKNSKELDENAIITRKVIVYGKVTGIYRKFI